MYWLLHFTRSMGRKVQDKSYKNESDIFSSTSCMVPGDSNVSLSISLCRKIFCRHSWSPEDVPCWLWWNSLLYLQYSQQVHIYSVSCNVVTTFGWIAMKFGCRLKVLLFHPWNISTSTERIGILYRLQWFIDDVSYDFVDPLTFPKHHLWFRVKWFDNYWMDWCEILRTHSCLPQDEWLWWSFNFSSSTITLFMTN